jgi:energy-converting hydrogenase Eha subunit C
MNVVYTQMVSISLTSSTVIIPDTRRLSTVTIPCIMKVMDCLIASNYYWKVAIAMQLCP